MQAVGSLHIVCFPNNIIIQYVSYSTCFYFNFYFYYIVLVNYYG